MDPAPRVIDKYEEAVAAMHQFMAQFCPQSEECGSTLREAEVVYNLKGDTARIAFIKRFKEVQRLKTQIDQYTDLDEAQKEKINTLLPEDNLRALRSSYLETAQRLKAQQGKTGDKASDDQEAVEQLDFEFVLFSSAIIDYDYIMGLIARWPISRQPSSSRPKTSPPRSPFTTPVKRPYRMNRRFPRNMSQTTRQYAEPCWNAAFARKSCRPPKM